MANEPPPGDEGITENPRRPKRSAPADSFDSDRSINRPQSSSSSIWLIAIVAGVAVLGLCLCVPALFLGGFVSFFHAREQRVVAAVQEAEAVNVQANGAKQQLNGFAKGTEEAKDAIAKDQLLLKEYPPLPAPGWHGEFIRLLKERCKCDYQVIGEPNLAKDRQDEIRGWNDSMQAELRRRHGATIMEELHRDGEKRWRDRIKPKKDQ